MHSALSVTDVIKLNKLMMLLVGGSANLLDITNRAKQGANIFCRGGRIQVEDDKSALIGTGRGERGVGWIMRGVMNRAKVKRALKAGIQAATKVNGGVQGANGGACMAQIVVGGEEGAVAATGTLLGAEIAQGPELGEQAANVVVVDAGRDVAQLDAAGRVGGVATRRGGGRGRGLRGGRVGGRSRGGGKGDVEGGRVQRGHAVGRGRGGGFDGGAQVEGGQTEHVEVGVEMVCSGLSGGLDGGSGGGQGGVEVCGLGEVREEVGGRGRG